MWKAWLQAVTSTCCATAAVAAATVGVAAAALPLPLPLPVGPFLWGLEGWWRPPRDSRQTWLLCCFG